MRPLSAIALFCATLLSAAPTFADNLADQVNALRRQGCGGKPGVSVPLRSNRKLDAVASRIAGGARLADALKAADYRALHSSSLSISNTKGDFAIARTIAQRACEELRNPTVRDIGIARKGQSVLVVLAEPFDTDQLKDAATVARRVLDLVNAARSRPRLCGSKQFHPVLPLRLSRELTDAARAHARDLASHNTLSHSGSDGSSPAERATRAGYAWRIVGENVASGPNTVESVVEGWLESPGHCANIMNIRFDEMGLGFVVDAKSESGVYWAQLFAAPRNPPAQPANKQ